MNRARTLSLFIFFTVVAGVATTTGQEDRTPFPVFTDVTGDAGIQFRHSFGDFELSNIVEATGAGAAFFDYDNDGAVDLYLVNGAWNKLVNDNRGRKLKGELSNRLYRNKGDGTFQDVTDDATWWLNHSGSPFVFR